MKGLQRLKLTIDAVLHLLEGTKINELQQMCR